MTNNREESLLVRIGLRCEPRALLVIRSSVRALHTAASGGQVDKLDKSTSGTVQYKRQTRRQQAVQAG